MRYQFIREHREEFSVQRMCQLLGVTRSGYYAWQPEKLCPRELENQVLVEQIRVEYKTSRQTYGSPRIWVRLLGRGVVNVGAKCPQIIGLKSPLFNGRCVQWDMLSFL